MAASGKQNRAHDSFDLSCQAYGDLVAQYIARAPFLSEWPGLTGELFGSLTGEHPWKVVLPMLACQTAGGDPETALPASAAWLCLRHAAHMLDAVADGDWNRVNAGSSPRPGLAAGLIFSALQFVTEYGDGSTVKRVLTQFSSSGLHSALGQSMFISPIDTRDQPEDYLERYWQATILKSGSIFQAGASAGAATATDRQDWIDALGDYGCALGVMLQVLDDCRDHVDDRSQHVTPSGLPILLENLMPGSDKQALSEALSQILLEWQRRALQALSNLPDSPGREFLTRIPAQILNLQSSVSVVSEK